MYSLPVCGSLLCIWEWLSCVPIAISSPDWTPWFLRSLCKPVPQTPPEFLHHPSPFSKRNTQGRWAPAEGYHRILPTCACPGGIFAFFTATQCWLFDLLCSWICICRRAGVAARSHLVFSQVITPTWVQHLAPGRMDSLPGFRWAFFHFVKSILTWNPGPPERTRLLPGGSCLPKT